MADQAAFIEARIADTERAAMAASGQWGRDATTPEHWRWECAEDDAPLDPDLAIAGHHEFLEHDPCRTTRVGLRSIEEYPSEFVGGLAHLVLHAEEVEPAMARHVLLHDPAAVMHDMAIARRVLARHRDCDPGCCVERDDLAARWEAHPDFDPDWRMAR